MGKSITGLALLLAGALIWAYLLTHPFGEAPPAGLVRVWRGEARQLRTLTFQSERLRVTVETEHRGDGEPYVWIRTERERSAPPGRVKGGVKGKDKASAGAETPEEKPEKKKVLRAFKGNKRAAHLVRNFAALEATRVVGGVDTLNRAEFGLAATGDSLQVVLEGEPAPFDLSLGAFTYGRQMRYALFKQDETVYLFRQSLFTNLTRAGSALMDRALFPFPVRQGGRIRISREGETVEMHRRDGAAPGEPAWGNTPEDVEGNPGFEKVVNSLSRLNVLEYLADQEAPAAAGLADAIPALEVSLFPRSKDSLPAAAWLRLYPEPKGAFVATASHTKKWVRLSGRAVKAVLQAADRVLNDEPGGAPPPGQKG